MGMKGASKVIDALKQLMDGYCELQEAIERDYGGRGEDAEDASSELSTEVDAALVTEIRAAIETVMEEEDFSAEEIASVISILTDSLEEIDPDVFEPSETEPASEEEEYEDYDEDEEFEEEDDEEDEGDETYGEGEDDNGDDAEGEAGDEEEEEEEEEVDVVVEV